MISFQSYWPRYVSLDWGFSHHSAIYWFASDGDKTYCYREWVVNHKTAPELAAGIVERTPNGDNGRFDERRMVKTFFAGPDIFARKTSDRTIAIEIESALAPHGFGFSGITPAAAGPGDRKLRWALVYQLLKDGRLKIAPGPGGTWGCPELAKAIPQAIRDFPNNAEDIKKVETIGDDCLDAFGMGVYTSSLQPRVPLEVAALRLVTAPLSNLTARAVQYKDAMADLRRGRRGIRFGR